MKTLIEHKVVIFFIWFISILYFTYINGSANLFVHWSYASTRVNFGLCVIASIVYVRLQKPIDKLKEKSIICFIYEEFLTNIMVYHIWSILFIVICLSVTQLKLEIKQWSLWAQMGLPIFIYSSILAHKGLALVYLHNSRYKRCTIVKHIYSVAGITVFISTFECIVSDASKCISVETYTCLLLAYTILYLWYYIVRGLRYTNSR